VIFRWTGFYAGLHLGGGGGSKDESSVPFSFAGSLITPAPFNIGVGGLLGGGQIGANYQSESFVIGVEAQASGANLTGSRTCVDTVTLAGVVVATGSASCTRESTRWERLQLASAMPSTTCSSMASSELPGATTTTDR
jgi:hypothetical protein